MPLFRVLATESIGYETEICAKSEDEALVIAEKMDWEESAIVTSRCVSPWHFGMGATSF